MKGTFLNFTIVLLTVLMVFLFLGNARAEQDGSMSIPSLFTNNAQDEQEEPLDFEVLYTYPCALPDENGDIGGYDRMCAEIVFLDGEVETPESAILNFTIFDADLDLLIGELTDDMVLNEDDLTAFAVVAETQGEFTDIIFDLYEVEEDGTYILVRNHVEGLAPYRLFGDTSEGYAGYALPTGSYELFAYGLLEGDIVSTHNVAFEVID